MKKALVFLLSLALVLAMSSSALATEYLVFSTGGTTGTYYAFGGEIAAKDCRAVNDRLGRSIRK